MNRALALAGLIACIALCLGSYVTRAQTTAPSPKLRVGVYDSRALAVAYSASSFHDAEMKALQKELDDAQAARDTRKVDQIKARGKNMQTVAHLQAFSNGPVDNAISKVRESLPVIAAAAGVDVIVADIDFKSDRVETVDVTNLLVAQFKPNDRTQKNIEMIVKQKRIPMVDVVGIQD
jgi:hypothetical protein